MKKLITYLFDHNTFFKTKNSKTCVEISFKILNKSVSIHFLENNKMIVMLIIEEHKINTYYSNDIEEFLSQVTIYNKIANECQQQIAVDYI